MSVEARAEISPDARGATVLFEYLLVKLKDHLPPKASAGADYPAMKVASFA
jgi:hypothetical protein